jgi:hypothetical protein
MNSLYPRQLLALLGSFWSRLFGSKELLKKLFQGVLSNHEQSERAATELVRSVGNQEIPAGQTHVWTKIVFSAYTQSPIVYGDFNKKYGLSGVMYAYGQLDNSRISYVIDSDVLDIPYLYDDVSNPTKVLTQGIDYKLEAGVIKFQKPLRTIEDTEKGANREVTLYARNVVREAGFTTSRLGYALGIQLSDKVYSKVPFKYLWRLGTYGPTYLDMLNMLGSCSGTPVTQKDETVEVFELQQGLALIITDSGAYATSAYKSNPIKINQILPQGTPLDSRLQILHDKDIYLAADIPAVYRDPKTFKYGRSSAIASSMVIIKCDIQGPQAAALKAFKTMLPVDVKVLIFTNIDVPATSINQANFSFNTKASYSQIVPALTINESQASVKATAKVKYSIYGY